MYNSGGPWVEHMKWVADYVKGLADGGLIVEIGAGNGEFAKLCNYQNYVAYEPCDDSAECARHVTTKNCYYSPSIELPLHCPEVILMRHVLEHYPDPAAYLRELSSACRAKHASPDLIVEVPNIEPCLENRRLEDWVYEHPQHFTPGSLTELARLSGWYVSDMHVRYNDEVLVAAMCPFHIRQVQCDSEDYDLVLANIATVRARLIAAGDPIILWGGAGKSATIINLLGLPPELVTVVDSDSRKWDKCVPGTPHLILPPVLLNTPCSPPCDVIVTTSWRTKDIVEEIVRDGYKVGKVFNFCRGRLIEYKG